MINIGTRVQYRADVRADIDPSERNDVGTVVGFDKDPTLVSVRWDSGWTLAERKSDVDVVVEGGGG